MSQYKKIVVFTNSYPYGNGYNWLDSEIELFHQHFEEVLISPYSFEGNKKAKEIPQYNNVKILPPVVEQDMEFRSLWQFRKLLNARIGFYITEFFRERVYIKSYWFKSWIQAVIKTENLLKSDIFKRLKSLSDKENTTLYFFWGNNQSLMVPFFKKMGFNKTLVRFHGFDLYKERLGGYQPFRRPLLRSLSIAAPISEFGRSYLLKEYQDVKFDCGVFRLGVKDRGRSPLNQSKTLKIVSCATIIPLKRIELIPNVLANLNRRIHWIHIGDGSYEWKVREILQILDSEQVSIELMGRIPADQVQEYYRKNSIDIFISLSSTEGIPVSIMEALAAGIPVFSTDVGGISELIDDACGKLVSVDLDKDQIAEELDKYIIQYMKNTNTIKLACHQRFLRMCNLDNINRDLLSNINNLGR